VTSIIRIGSRGSALALVQANGVRAALGDLTSLTVIKTTGDNNQETPLELFGGVGVFTKELERALLRDQIDLAVHSLKDLPVEQPAGLCMGAIPSRAPPADLLLVRKEALDLDQEFPVKHNAILGTSSSRRRALAANYRPDIRAVNLRGNVPTRLRKCVDGECDAIILAHAGLHRLECDLSNLVVFELNPFSWPCAPGQGALGLEVREGDEKTIARLSCLEHSQTRACVDAERMLLQVTGGGCHSAFGALAQVQATQANITIAMLDDAYGFRLSQFEGINLDAVVQEAVRWLNTGAPPMAGLNNSKEWLCRPLPVSS
jgi:hydroxymethylbilane synthase